MSRRFKRLAAEAGVPVVSLHEGGRHTGNSLMRDAGVDQEVQMRQVGHADREVNDRYTHVMEEAPAGRRAGRDAGTGGGSMTDYERLGALVADCDDDTELIDILTPVIAAMPKARRNQLLESNPIRDPRKYDRCPECGADTERGWRHSCQPVPRSDDRPVQQPSRKVAGYRNMYSREASEDELAAAREIFGRARRRVIDAAGDGGTS